MDFLHSSLAFIIAISVLVVVHELGHYWVARVCNVKVLRFSLGFGPTLYAKKIGPDQTEWAVCAIPLGGYVSMLNENSADTTPISAQDLPRAYSRKPVKQRMMIVLAGPLANFVLALLFYFVLGMTGLKEPKALLDAPVAGSPAAYAGVLQGDEILRINDKPVRSWVECRWKLLEAALERAQVSLELKPFSGSPREVVLDLSGLSADDLEKNVLQSMGLRLLQGRPKISQVESGSVADLAGVRVDDILLSANQLAVSHVANFIQQVRESSRQAMQISVLREGRQIDIVVTPATFNNQKTGQAEGRLGVALAAEVQMVEIRLGWFDSLWYGVTKTWDTAIFSLKMLGKMLIGQISLNQLSGPLTIADYAGQSAKVGLEHYIGFLALISISIGVLNLLPIPMLDGGHLMYHVLELVRKKPLADSTQDLLQRLGMGILAAMMSVALFNDLVRLFA
jgi:regulator of sigma E protease